MTAKKPTTDAIMEALAAGDPLSIVELAAAVGKSESATRAALWRLIYANMAHWCGHKISRVSPGRYQRIFAPGQAPIPSLVQSPITKSTPRNVMPIPRPALHPMLAWGVAA